MDKSIAVILLLTPGFIAKTIDKAFGSSSAKESYFDTLMEYFIYSAISIIFGLFACHFWGYINLFQSFDEMFWSFRPEYILKFFILADFFALIIGLTWNLLFRQLLLKTINNINNRIEGRTNVYWNGSLYNVKFNDGHAHFVVVKKAGEIIAMGFADGSSDSSEERTELWITQRKEYWTWWEYAQNSTGNEENIDPNNDGRCLKETIGVYIDATNDIIIEEHEFPSSWEHNKDN